MPNPEGLSFEQWAAQVYDTFPFTVPQPFSEDRWREWGDIVGGAFQVTGWTIPTTRFYKTWQPWAEAFLAAYPKVGL